MTSTPDVDETTNSVGMSNLEVSLEALSRQTTDPQSSINRVELKKIAPKDNTLAVGYSSATSLFSNSPRTAPAFLKQQDIIMDQPANSPNWNPIDPFRGGLALAVGKRYNLRRTWVIGYRLCWINGLRSLCNACDAWWPAFFEGQCIIRIQRVTQYSTIMREKYAQTNTCEKYCMIGWNSKE